MEIMEETKNLRFSDTEKGSMERVERERERERERECLRCTDKALYKCTKIELSLSPIIL